MQQSAEAFRDKIRQIAENLGLICNVHSSTGNITIEFTPAFPLHLNLHFDENKETAFLFVSGRAHGIDGDKSDYHDLLSAIYAISLRLTDVASARIFKIEMADILPGEVYSFDIAFDKQPPATFIDLTNPDFALIENILKESAYAAGVISIVWQTLGEDDRRVENLSEEGLVWASSIASQFKLDIQDFEITHFASKQPSWEYFTISDQDIFAIRARAPFTTPVLVERFRRKQTLLQGANGQIIHSEFIKNFIHHKTLKKCSKVLKAFGKKLRDAVIIPVESHVFLLLDNGIIGIRSESGLEVYLEERQQILQRHQLESKILLPSVNFGWADRVNDEEFEKLIVELLAREPGIHRVRKIGKGNEPDFGRDILVEWYRPVFSRPGESPIKLFKIIVQCKAYRRPVDKSKVQDIMDLLYYHNATGYLLVGLSGLTRPLIDFLERIDQRDGYWTDWWSRIEIEEKLRQNRDIAKRYSHLVNVIDEL